MSDTGEEDEEEAEAEAESDDDDEDEEAEGETEGSFISIHILCIRSIRIASSSPAI